MISFTDDDLKYLKKESTKKAYWLPVGLEEDKNVRLLIARLECAEAYAEFRIRFSSGHDGEKEKLEAWEKSKGER